MKLTFLPKILLAFALLTMMAILHPSVTTVAHAQSKMSPPVTGKNLLVAHFPGGRFEVIGQGAWAEYDRNSNLRYTFREIHRDANSVYLREDALAVELELNATRRIIMASWPGMARHQLHRIDRVKAQPRTDAPLLVTPPPPPVRPTPPATRPVAVRVTPSNLTQAVYAGGRFEEAGTGTGVWTQYSNAGGVSTYAEIGYDDKAVYLYDQGRNVLILLEVRGKMIRESRNGGLVKKQYSSVEMLTAQKPERPSYALTRIQRSQCLASGGKVERAGMLGAERCTLSYRDGGQVCTDSSQCQGKCMAELAGANQNNTSGICQRTDNPFGCYAFVENGRTGPALCTD